MPGDQPQRILIHDRDSIYAAAVDSALAAMGLTVLKTPVRCPLANAFCERLIGTIRRECLDWLILLNERHLRSVLREWVAHYNQGRPHASLDPGIPDLPLDRRARPSGHQKILVGHHVIAKRKQLALYVERQVKPRRADDATRIALVALSWLIDWRRVLTVVKPDTLVRWHRKGFRLLWRWKSRHRGRPRVPTDVRPLICDMAAANRTWGEERIASELLLKLGIRVSPRTVRRYMPIGGAPRDGTRSQLWSTFVRNHASAVLACDFFVAITASFRVFYVFVVLEAGTRRIALECDRTSHGGLDSAAIPNAGLGRRAASIPDPRSRQHLLRPCRSNCHGNGPDGSPDAVAIAASERVLRTGDRHDSARVPGLDDSVKRASPPPHPSGVGHALQSWASTREPWTGHS
jgi:hypothetical protein